jgi:hypothetical protein
MNIYDARLSCERAYKILPVIYLCIDMVFETVAAETRALRRASVCACQLRFAREIRRAVVYSRITTCMAG